MKPNAEALEVCADELGRVLPIARERYGYMHVPPVLWDIRGARIHGQALCMIGDPTTGRIRLNVATANAEGAAFRSVVGHEVAHLVAVAHWRAHGDGHGAAWVSVMRSFGLPPEVSTHFASAASRISEARTRRGGMAVVCACGWSGTMTAGQVEKMNAGRIKVSCPKCRAPIRGGV